MVIVIEWNNQYLEMIFLAIIDRMRAGLRHNIGLCLLDLAMRQEYTYLLGWAKSSGVQKTEVYGYTAASFIGRDFN